MTEDLLSALAAADGDEPAAELLTAVALAAASGRFVRMSPEERWALFATALQAPRPSVAFEALRAQRALAVLLPELDALFGVPQLSDGPEWLDVGQHQWRFIDETARAGAPLALRFAALVHKIGKAGTPREIWPHHYKHEERGHAAVEALARRAAVPADAVDMAHLAIDELDRVHRASDIRAGPIALMLERLDARQQPDRFERLMLLCTCDWSAFEGHRPDDYPKADRLRRALQATLAVDVTGLDADAALQARAEAIAAALGSGARLRA